MNLVRSSFAILTLGVLFTPAFMSAETVVIKSGNLYLLKRKQKKNPGRPQAPGKPEEYSGKIVNI